jgi:hypothetical protein
LFAIATINTTGISHITLYADDFSKSQQFFQSLLGWDMVPSGPAKSRVRFYVNHLQTSRSWRDRRKGGASDTAT